MNVDITVIIMHIAITAAAIALPTLGAFAYNKFKGNAKFSYAVNLISEAISALKAYAVQHPEIIKDGQAIYNFVKTRIISVLPITDEEFDYLFESVEAAIAALLGVDVAIFTSVKLSAPNPKKRIFGRKRRLFA